jgi:hypothetical protein
MCTNEIHISVNGEICSVRTQQEMHSELQSQCSMLWNWMFNNTDDTIDVSFMLAYKIFSWMHWLYSMQCIINGLIICSSLQMFVHQLRAGGWKLFWSGENWVFPELVKWQCKTVVDQCWSGDLCNAATNNAGAYGYDKRIKMSSILWFVSLMRRKHRLNIKLTWDYRNWNHNSYGCIQWLSIHMCNWFVQTYLV